MKKTQSNYSVFNIKSVFAISVPHLEKCQVYINSAIEAVHFKTHIFNSSTVLKNIFLKRRIPPCLIALVSIEKGHKCCLEFQQAAQHPDPAVWWPEQAEVNRQESTGQHFTIRASASHLVELLPRQGPLHTPGPDRPLLLNCILKDGLEREEHAEDVLGTLHAHIHNCKDKKVIKAYCNNRMQSSPPQTTQNPKSP